MSSTAGGEAGRRLRLADYYRQRMIGAPAVSPDGTRVAFTVEGYRKKENDRYTNLWIVPSDGSRRPHRLTRGESSDGAPQWSPDGKRLAFLSTRPHEIEVAQRLAEEAEAKEAAPAKPDGAKPGGPTGEAPDSGRGHDKPKPQIWVFDMESGGEPRQLTWREEGVREFAWSPDGRRMVFSSRAPSEEQKKYLKSVREDKGPLVLDRVQHKFDGRGFLDEVPTHLFVVDLDSRECRQITDGPCDETSPRWSPDGRWILFASNRTGDADNNKRTDLWLVAPDGQAAARLTFGDLSVFGARFSADSRHVVFVGSREPENAYVVNHLMVLEVAAADPVDDLAACVGRGWSSIGGIVPDLKDSGDLAEARRVENARVYPVAERATPARVLTGGLDRPVVGMPIWIDANTVVAPVGDRGQTRLVRASLNRAPELVFPFDRGCTLAGFDAAGGVAVAIVDRPETGAELFALPVTTLGSPQAQAQQITAIHAEFLSDLSLARYERITFRNHDGVELEGLVAVPPGWEPSQGPAPLLVTIHGGPMSYDSPGFRFDRQYWAGMGYLVLMVNYRGSISYGEDFCRVIQGDWGPREHDDVMSGVQHLVDRGWANPDRLFCTGFSQGGIMTNWAVGHTDRFRAAVSEHGMWDYAAAYGTDDCHLWWQDDLGVPWQNPEGYERISPKSGLANIRTPLLITAGEHDWRCPLDQAELLYMALKKRGVDTELVVYQDEHHAVAKPKRGIDRIRRVAEWLARYGGIGFEDDTAEGYPSGRVSPAAASS